MEWGGGGLFQKRIFHPLTLFLGKKLMMYTKLPTLIVQSAPKIMEEVEIFLNTRIFPDNIEDA